MRQVISGLVMFVTGAAVTGALHELLRFHIKLAQAVDDNMYMDVPASVTSIHVGTDQSLMPRKILFCIFHSYGLRPLRRQTAVNLILGVKADDVMMRFDFCRCLIFMILLIKFTAFFCIGKWIAVDSIQDVAAPPNHFAVLVKDRLYAVFFMLKQKVEQRIVIIGIFTCSVF